MTAFQSTPVAVSLKARPIVTAGFANEVDEVNPAVVEVMLEQGIDISGNKPKVLTDELVQDSDYVITMGCGDTCPFYPGKIYLDWPLQDPAGKGPDFIRPIRDEIKILVENLISEIDAKNS